LIFIGVIDEEWGTSTLFSSGLRSSMECLGLSSILESVGNDSTDSWIMKIASVLKVVVCRGKTIFNKDEKWEHQTIEKNNTHKVNMVKTSYLCPWKHFDEDLLS